MFCLPGSPQNGSPAPSPLPAVLAPPVAVRRAVHLPPPAIPGSGSPADAPSAQFVVPAISPASDSFPARFLHCFASRPSAIAHLTVKRYVPLVGTKYISQQEYDQAIADARQADAAVIAAKATVESARINLAYTKVTAPISGRIGKSTVTEGALVTNGQTTELATVQQLDPIYVDVTQSSNDFMRLKQSVEQGNLHKENATSNVELVMENGQTYPRKGPLQFSDVTVDESTGSITLRAVFPNPQHTLLPGMFVRARIDEGVQPDAILIPQQGVSRTPRGDATVLIVNDKSQVEARPVVASQAIGDKWLISEGLKSGDQVIVSGLQKARPGEQVKATTDTPADTASK
eukprot:149987_1